MRVSKWLNSYRVHVNFLGRSVYIASYATREEAEFASKVAETMKLKLKKWFPFL